MVPCLREEVEVLEAGAGDEVLDAADVDLDAVDLAGAELGEGGEHRGELRVAHVVLRHHDAERRSPAQPPPAVK